MVGTSVHHTAQLVQSSHAHIMQQPNKRPRHGPAPFEDDDDPEDDELNSRPEEVNARRDPGLRLERSRAFAAFKLKSAFERIFEKYEKDFTGVGDEIDLRTGEIVVDNGHIQSLKDVRMGGADDDAENSEYAASETGSMNYEERAMQGRPDRSLSRPNQNALPSIPPQAGQSPLFAGGWPAPAPLLGGPPRLSTMLYPAQMPFGGFPMQYGVPAPAPATDPTWSAPELPSPFWGNGFRPRENGIPVVKKKKARMSLAATPEHGADDEDDILLGSSTSQDKENQGVVMKKKLLLPRPVREKQSAKKKKPLPVGGSNRTPDGPKAGKNPSSKTTPAEKLSSERGCTSSKPDAAHPSANPTTGNHASETSVGTNRAPPRPSSAGTDAPTCHSTSAGENQKSKARRPSEVVPGTADQESSQKNRVSAFPSQQQGTGGSRQASNGAKSRAVTRSTSRPATQAGTGTSNLAGLETATGKTAPVKSRQPNQLHPVPDHPQPEEPDIYLDLSRPEVKFTRKPQNQILRVEIAAKTPSDVRSFRILTPEPSDADSPRPRETDITEHRSEEVPAIPEAMNTGSSEPDGNLDAENGCQVPTAPIEVFSRNVVDPAYAFSDEDEPTLPRRKARNANKVDKAGRDAASGAPCNVAMRGRPQEAAESLLNMDDSTSLRAELPSASAQLDDDVGLQAGGLGEKSAENRDASQALNVVGDGADGGGRYRSVDPPKRRISRRVSILDPEESSIIRRELESSSTATVEETELGTEITLSSKGEPSSSSEAQQNTPTRAAPNPLASLEESRQQESLELPSEIQRTNSPPLGGELSTRPPEIPDSGPPVSSADVDRASSPTLTDPSSRRRTTEPASASKQLSASSIPPSTPTKKSRHRALSKTSHRQPSSSTPATTTSTLKRQRSSILSLVSDDDEDGVDELAITPHSHSRHSRQTPGRLSSSSSSFATTPIPFRTSPAAHHVRLALLHPSARATATPPGASTSSINKRKKRNHSEGARPSASSSSAVSTLTRGVLVSSATKAAKAAAAATAATAGDFNGMSTPSGRRSGASRGDGGIGAAEEMGELVQTPGGTMRRCGEGGFRCGRDFCFVCL